MAITHIQCCTHGCKDFVLVEEGFGECLRHRTMSSEDREKDKLFYTSNFGNGKLRTKFYTSVPDEDGNLIEIEVDANGYECEDGEEEEEED